MITKNIFKYLAVGLVCCGFAGAFTSCSSDEDPFFSISENDAPRILNTDIPEGKGEEPAVLMSIDRTQNFEFEVIVTPVHYTDVVWYIDHMEVARGLSINVPVLAGEHTVTIVATTTKGLSTSRTCKLVVRPVEGDPELATDAKSRWFTVGTTKTIECNNVSSVAKVFIGTEEATNVSYANGKLTFDIPTLDEDEYFLSIEDAEGNRFGCGWCTVSNEAYVDPGIKETVLWEGATDINWGDANVLLSADQMAVAPVGATIRLEYEMIDAEYHAMRITTPWWGDNAEDNIVSQFDVTAETPNPFEFTYTEAHKALIEERGGMLIVGFGYKLKKVVLVEGVAPAENKLWEGAIDINWGDANVQLSAEQMAEVPVGATVNLHFEMIDAEYHAMRITTPWWGDNAEDNLVGQFDVTADTPNPFQFTYTEACKALVDERGGMLIVGFGYKLTKVTYTE